LIQKSSELAAAKKEFDEKKEAITKDKTNIMQFVRLSKKKPKRRLLPILCRR